jgi:glutathionylspermidine synthase
LHQPGQDLETGGGYGAEGFIYQALAPRAGRNGTYPVVGSWVIGHDEGKAAAGMGIRESSTPITTNLSQFVPHMFG